MFFKDKIHVIKVSFMILIFAVFFISNSAYAQKKLPDQFYARDTLKITPTNSDQDSAGTSTESFSDKTNSSQSKGVCYRDAGWSIGLSAFEDFQIFLFGEYDIFTPSFLTFRAGFTFRPYSHSTKVPIRQNYLIQYQEWRGSFEMGLSKKFYMNNHTAFSLEGGGLFSFGDYDGSSESAETSKSLWGGASLGFFGNGFRALTLFYQYYPQPHISSHRFGISIGLPFGDHWIRG
jgi:hypothetical protein